MKNIFLLAISSIICLVSCKGKKHHIFYNKQHFTTKRFPYHPLRNQPVKVIEFFYRGVENISLEPLPSHGEYESYSFNKNGDPSEYVFHLDANRSFTITTVYKNDGLQEIMNDNNTTVFEERLIREVHNEGAGRFVQTLWDKQMHGTQQIIVFENNGDQMIVTAQKEDSAGGRSYMSETVDTKKFKGDLLISQSVITSADGTRATTERKFYYDKNDHPDSIITNSLGEKSRIYFKHNQQGDPVEEISVTGYDTTAHFTRNFIYDKKGNWIRMLEKDEKNEQGKTGKSPFVFIERKITY